MFCPNCGTKLPDSVKFCTSCGAKVTPVAPASQSPRTGRISDTAPLPMASALNTQPHAFTYGTEARKRGRNGSLLPLALVAVVAVVAIAVSAIVFFGPATSDQSPDEPTREANADSTVTTHEPTDIQADEPTVTTVDTESPVDTQHTNEYVLTDSSTRRYTAAELSALSDWELYLARNEIYARHGREFANDDLRRHFEATSWYRPSYTPEEFDAAASDLLSDVERANIDTILSIEQERDSAYL